MDLKIDHLLHLEFKVGLQDCYTLARNFFRDNFGIELTDYARPDNWDATDLNLFMRLYQKEGFELMDIMTHEVQIGDVFLMAIGSAYPNHCAIYVGDGQIIHHYYGRRSVKEAYLGPWRRATVATLRHKKLKDLSKDFQTLDIMELIPASYFENLKNEQTS